MNYPFKVCGNIIKIHRYAVVYIDRNPVEVDINNDEESTEPKFTEIERTMRFNTEQEAQAFAERFNGSIQTLDTTTYEWIDGIETPDASNTFAEAVKIYDMGQAAYETQQQTPKDNIERLRADIDFLAVMTGVEL